MSQSGSLNTQSGPLPLLGLEVEVGIGLGPLIRKGHYPLWASKNPLTEEKKPHKKFYIKKMKKENKKQNQLSFFFRDVAIHDPPILLGEKNIFF